MMSIGGAGVLKPWAPDEPREVAASELTPTVEHTPVPSWIGAGPCGKRWMVQDCFLAGDGSSHTAASSLGVVPDLA